jgi:AraC-like DNA-binding protein
MISYRVSSLPLKDVIKNLAEEMKTTFFEQCSEYIVNVPKKLGSGDIRGINFDNGLGIIIYQCQFNQPTEVKFTVDKVHPLKYIYTANGAIKHQFSNEKTVHNLLPRMCALVASENHKGHILKFEANTRIDLISLEIDREKFIEKTECHLVNLTSELSEMLKDTEASKTFYHEGFYSLEFQQILNSIDDYKEELLVRKFHLESRALDIFIEQIKLFEDDIKGESKELLLRYNELERIKDLSNFIDENLDKELTISDLSKQSGLNPSKLQKGFKHIFNKTVRDFVIYKRIEKAKFLLLSTRQSMSSISVNSGFESPSYFSKVFKEYYGHSPSDFRKLYNNHS